MGTIRDRIEGDITVKEGTGLLGMVVGTVTVCKGANLQLHGMIVGKLCMEPGSEVFIHGMLNGDVINKGGYLYVFGTVNGKIHDEGGMTKIDAKATVRQAS